MNASLASCLCAALLSLTAVARAQSAERANVVTVSGSAGVAFAQVGDPVFGVGPGVGYERVLAPWVSIGVGAALAVALPYGDAGVSAGISVPFYFEARAPVGLSLAPVLSVAMPVEYDPELGIGGGLSLGYQHVFDSGFVLGVSGGPTITVVQQLGSDVTFGIGAGVAAGYAF